MADMKKIGRNNKNRGRAFERRMAKQLPHFWRVDDLLDAGRAGLIEHDLGDLDGGDLVDQPPEGGEGMWLLECKTQPAGNVSIKDKWLTKLLKRAAATGRLCGVVTTRYKEIGGWVVLPNHDERKTARTFSLMHGIWPVVCWETKTRGKGQGYVIQDSWLDNLEEGQVARLDVHGDEPASYLIMRIATFKRYFS